jgi:hypothetical protein
MREGIYTKWPTVSLKYTWMSFRHKMLSDIITLHNVCSCRSLFNHSGNYMYHIFQYWRFLYFTHRMCNKQQLFTIGTCNRDVIFHEVDREYLILVWMNLNFFSPLHNRKVIRFLSFHSLLFPTLYLSSVYLYIFIVLHFVIVLYEMLRYFWGLHPVACIQLLAHLCTVNVVALTVNKCANNFYDMTDIWRCKLI